MKNTLYDRLESATTEQLMQLRDLYLGMMARRETTPRFDFHGKCVTRCTLILEARGVLPTKRRHTLAASVVAKKEPR